MSNYRVATASLDLKDAENVSSEQEAVRKVCAGRDHIVPVWVGLLDEKHNTVTEQRWCVGTCFVCKDAVFGSDFDPEFWASGYMTHKGCATRWRSEKSKEADSWICPRCKHMNMLGANECEMCHS